MGPGGGEGGREGGGEGGREGIGREVLEVNVYLLTANSQNQVVPRVRAGASLSVCPAPCL